MRRVFIALAGLAVALCATSSVFANSVPLYITLDNLSNGGQWWNPPFNNPQTTTGGALWIATSPSGYNSGPPPVLLDEDVNILFAVSQPIPGGGWTALTTIESCTRSVL